MKPFSNFNMPRDIETAEETLISFNVPQNSTSRLRSVTGNARPSVSNTRKAENCTIEEYIEKRN